VPEYLGIGPREYYDKELAIPRYSKEEETPELRESLIRWLQRVGVTHILAQEPLDESAWPVGRVSVFQDPFLNAAWGRMGQDLFLYSLNGSRPLAFLEQQPDGGGVVIERREPESVVLKVQSDREGRVVLLDLPYPGWQVSVDGEPKESEVFEEMFRSVQVPPGEHVVEWRFVPRSFYAGCMLFGLGVAALIGWMALERTRHKRA
jgi:hypothetical protein